MEPSELEKAIVEKLKTVIDPETGADVIRMQLVQSLQVDETGRISYVFRPSSPLCPLAVPLSVAIIQAINQVPGVTKQSIKVVDYDQADLLTELLNSVLEE